MSGKRTTLFIDEELFKQLKIHCAENGLSLKEFINSAISEKLKI